MAIVKKIKKKRLDFGAKVGFKESPLCGNCIIADGKPRKCLHAVSEDASCKLSPVRTDEPLGLYPSVALLLPTPTGGEGSQSQGPPPIVFWPGHQSLQPRVLFSSCLELVSLRTLIYHEKNTISKCHRWN